MLRDRKKPLQFPILKDSKGAGEPDGYLSFPEGNLFRAVDAIEPGEIRRRLNSIFKGDERKLWDGLYWLRYAYKSWNEAKLREGTEMVRPWVSRVKGWKNIEPVETRWERARFQHASLLSNALQGARLVSWWAGGKEQMIAPAVFCPDWKTAAFVALWRGALKICPWCEQPFVPEKDNQDFCEPKHGQSWRTAKSRAKKGQPKKGAKSAKLRRKSLQI